MVAVRATFDIAADGRVTPAEVQEPVSRSAEYPDKPGSTGPLYDVDLVRVKNATDILLNGHAYAPPGRPVPEREVRLTVGSVSKSLVVYGDRLWEKRMLRRVPSAPVLFERLPIVYERAFGGCRRDASDSATEAFPPNPIGVGYNAETSPTQARLPNVIDPGAPPIRSVADTTVPAGFGAIDCAWEPRRSLAGAYDDVWLATRSPLVPNDFDERFFNCAPVDQQADGYLRGGERVELTNLSATNQLVFELPRVRLGFDTRIAGRLHHHRASLHTVLIEPDRERLVMVWHTSLRCHDAVYQLERTTVFEKEPR